ncbi:PPC domain-containing protein [Telmatocola sphagniphila]|uniref:PPC domain-containing protein n=1 Tax=Telmatocola sphagniphila TaxID=1123043 RepID=A0A8E6EVN2_9BACT|nr:PPC domain-containing protein [Telmatocola sphagniphila]QVL32965.1 PPC domain-containing protein [Telmatocola sphagniphila]
MPRCVNSGAYFLIAVILPRRYTTVNRLLGFTFLLVFASFARASNPQLSTIMPRGGERGTEVDLVFTGSNLDDAKDVFFYDDHFEVISLDVLSKQQVAVHLRIKNDCPLGEHYFRLRCDSGITPMCTFWVGPFPVIDEKEPNNEFTAPQKIPLNVTVHGTITNEDNDYFQVELKKGQRLAVEIEAMRLGEAFFDPYVAILDSKRFELSASDDSPLFSQDGLLSIIAPADGKYYVQVRETAYQGSGNSHYRLHVHTYPRPLGVLPLGGKPGEEMDVTFIGDATGPLKRRIKVPMGQLDTKVDIFAEENGKTAASGVPIRLSNLTNYLKTQPNNTVAQAIKVGAPGAINGVVEKPNDVDYYRFTAKKGEVYDFRVFARQLGSTLDSVLQISNDKGAVLAANDDSGGPDSYFRFGIPADGDYILGIYDHLRKGGPNYFYRIEVAPVQAKVELTTVKPVQYSQDRQSIAVPRGNRFAVLLSAGRQDWGGDLKLGWDALPTKVKASTNVMAANMTVQPIVFEADADAPIETRFVQILGSAVDPKLQLVSHFHQTPEMILGQNNSIFWAPRLPKAAIAVTKEAPFSVRIVEPKVPLVQNGTMNLKIVAERKNGFKGPINIYPLYNPPGVGSAGSATIPDGQTETILPLNANGGAPVRKWDYVVQAEATVGDGPVWVSSQLATLEIASPFMAVTIERGAVEQGKDTQMFVKLKNLQPFDGKATIRLVNLPPKVATQDIQFDKGTAEVAFPLKTEATTPAGIHRNIFCNVVILKNGEPISHNLGASELRVDVPIVAAKPPANTPPKPNQPAANPAQPTKRLSRLEQLRLEQEEREKASKEEKKDK